MDKAKQQEVLMQTATQSEDPVLANAAKTSLAAQKAVIRIFDIFYEFVMAQDLDFNFAFLVVEHHYESNYSKLQNSDIYIEFSANRVIPFKDALAVAAVQPDEDEKNGYYYIYSSRRNIEKFRANKQDFGKEILTYIAKNWKL